MKKNLKQIKQILCTDLHEVDFEEIKDVKIFMVESNEFKFFTTIETLAKVIEKYLENKKTDKEIS